MHVPIKFIPNFTDPARKNENSDLRSETNKFEDNFTQAQQRALQEERSAHKEFGSSLRTSNLETEVDFHNLDRENKLLLNDNTPIVPNTEWSRQGADKTAALHLEGHAFVSDINSATGSFEAPKAPLKDGENYNETNSIPLTSEFILGVVDKQHTETGSLEAPKLPLNAGVSLNETNEIPLTSEFILGVADKQREETGNLKASNSLLKSGDDDEASQDTKLSSKFSESIDDAHLTLPGYVKFVSTTARANSDFIQAGSDTQETATAEEISATQLLKRRPTSFEQIRIEKNATDNTSKTFAFDRQSFGYVYEDGIFLNNAVESGAVKSRVGFLTLLGGSDHTSEVLSGPDSITEFGMFKKLSKVSITSSLKTKLKARASSLHYSALQFNEIAPGNYDLGRVLQSVIGAKGSPFVNLDQTSAQFVIPTTLHFSSKNNISPKHEIGNVFSVEKEALATDILRNAAVVKFSAIGDLNARNPNDNQFDKSISVDVPRTYKLDMSLNTWQKVLSSQISKAALENITKLQFTLNPKKLGRVSVTLQMDAGNVNVSIFSSNGHVANILQTSEGKLETLLSDHGMKLASYNVSSEQNGRDKRDRAPTNGRQSGIVERDGSMTAGGLQSESKLRTSNTHNGDYDYLV